MRRVLVLSTSLVVAVALAMPSLATPRTTETRTIRDRDGDDLLEYAPGEDYIVLESEGIEPTDDDFLPPRDGSILNFLQLTDFQLVDEESPGRVEFIDGTQRGPFSPFSAAYRPQESTTTQIEEAMVRAARNTTSPITGELLDLAILTGDNADSQQFNETRWFIDILDGTAGPRDRSRLPDPEDHGEAFDIPTDFQLPDKIDPNSGIPRDEPGCEATPGTIYDGVRGDGVRGAFDLGYYEPDSSSPQSDGDGYSPDPAQNAQETGRRVTVRDFPGLFEAANQPFEAIGLDMPWYSAFGNHDALVQGNSSDAYFGPTGPGYPDNGEIANPSFHGYVTGCAKVMVPPSALPTTFPGLVGFIINFLNDPQGYLEDNPSHGVAVPPDHRRCYLAKDEGGTGAPAPCDFAGWIQQHFVTTGTPVGHGFAPAPCVIDEPIDQEDCAGYGRPLEADLNNDGYYSFTPTPGLRFAVLDTITDDCGSPFCSEGSVDHPQFLWLEEQIHMAEALGEYVMVFSHHTLRTTRFPSTDLSEHPMHYGQRVDPDNPANPQNPSGERTLEDLYCENPNVIAHVAGHEHENFVKYYECSGEAIDTPDGSISTGVGPGDFWHISTAAHIDWPQQSRMIELIDNGDATMSMVLTMLDHDGPPNPGNFRECNTVPIRCKDPQTESFARGHSGEQVLKIASIGREIAYNDYQGSRGALGSREDRNVIVLIDRPWPYPTDD